MNCLPCPPHPTQPTPDFGLCELLDPGNTHVSNHHKGTPYYVAPETVLQHQVSGWGRDSSSSRAGSGLAGRR